jgi:hypothetical protein
MKKAQQFNSKKPTASHVDGKTKTAINLGLYLLTMSFCVFYQTTLKETYTDTQKSPIGIFEKTPQIHFIHLNDELIPKSLEIHNS